jgi:hypothetical protein
LRLDPPGSNRVTARDALDQPLIQSGSVARLADNHQPLTKQVRYFGGVRLKPLDHEQLLRSLHGVVAKHGPHGFAENTFPVRASAVGNRHNVLVNVTYQRHATYPLHKSD